VQQKAHHFSPDGVADQALTDDQKTKKTGKDCLPGMQGNHENHPY
jgi:hypothetical protein